MNAFAGYESSDADSDGGSGAGGACAGAERSTETEVLRLPQHSVVLGPEVDISEGSGAVEGNGAVSVYSSGVGGSNGGVPKGPMASSFAATYTEHFYNGAPPVGGAADDAKRKQSAALSKKLKKKRRKNDDPFADDYVGPWADYEDGADAAVVAAAVAGTKTPAEADRGAAGESDAETPEEEEEQEEPAAAGSSATLFVDYDFMVPPPAPKTGKASLRAATSYVPKRTLGSFEAHQGGVNKLQLFPVSGHLLLTCGNDGKIRLWDTYRHKKSQAPAAAKTSPASASVATLVQEYHAHTSAVKHVFFNSDGSRFLSCSYDTSLILWDTKTGEIVHRYKFARTVPNVAIFNPNNESEIVVGLSNHKIMHYDTSAAATADDPIQIYSHHLGAINSLTAVDDNKRFMSTADDKSVRFWDWQINIPVKVISEPTSHSMPCVALTPALPGDGSAGDYIALQCMDNSIQVIKGHGKFKFNHNKKFRGHNVAGYGIDVAFSPDGRTIMSGDSRGRAFFWDWKSTKLIKRLSLDSKPITCIQPFPLETSRVVMGGTSGTVYVCD